VTSFDIDNRVTQLDNYVSIHVDFVQEKTWKSNLSDFIHYKYLTGIIL